LHSFWLFGSRALLIGTLLVSASACSGQDVQFEATGARFGFSPVGAGRNFHEAEGFANWNLPWIWDLGSLWRLRSWVDVSGGWIGESGDNGAIVTAGPSLSVGKEASVVCLNCGISPTLLTRWDFPTKDLGTAFQFTSHAEIDLEVSSRVRLSYRFQHMSNAGLSRHNPGLNLVMLGLSYVF
jgi:hypothetical protein